MTSGGIFETIFGGFISAIGGAVEKFIELAFMVNLIETNGVFPLGKPVSSLTGDPGFMTIFTDGPFVYYAAQIYDMVWLPAGGGLTALAVIVLLIGNAASGYVDMFKFSPSQQSQTDANLLKGLVTIIAWYPLYMGLIGLVHGIIIAFAPGSSLGSLFIKQIFGSVLTGGTILATLGPPGWIIAILALLPFLLLSILMGIRAIVMIVMLAIGPFLVAVKHADLPIVSGAADKALSKTIPVVMMPLPMGPILFVVGNFILGVGGSAAILVSSTAGTFVVMILGWALLLSVWYAFKIVSPTLAGAVGGVTKIGMAATLAATGNGFAASSAMRGGPASAAARMMGNKMGGGGGPWGGDDGSR